MLYLDSGEVIALVPNDNGTDIYLRNVPNPIKVKDSLASTKEELNFSTGAKEMLNGLTKAYEAK